MGTSIVAEIKPPVVMTTTPANNKELLDTLTVFGYIRENCQNINIPNDIILVCFMFYYLALDEWNPETCHKDFIIDAASLSNRSLEERDVYGYKKPFDSCNAFGSCIIQKPMKRMWKIQTKNKHPFLFGIVSSLQASKSMSASFPFCGNGGIGIYSSNGFKYKESGGLPYGKRLSINGTMAMTLDLSQENEQNGLLYYNVDGIDQGNAFDDIDINGSYVMAFSSTKTSKGIDVELIL